MADQDSLNGINLNKLKVAELKKELKDRGLATTGNKTELLERLLSSMENNKHDMSADSVDDIDEDDVLNDEEIEEEADDIKSEELDIYPTQKVKIKQTETCDSTDVNTTKCPKKVVLNRTPSNPEEPKQTVEQSSLESENTEKKVIKLSELTAQERLEMRSKKFGAPVTDQIRKQARAERFGIVASTNDKKLITFNKNGNVPTSSDTLQKRAARFGIGSSAPTLSKVQKVELLEKRKARFASSSSPPNKKPDIEQQKALRLERFKQ